MTSGVDRSELDDARRDCDELHHDGIDIQDDRRTERSMTSPRPASGTATPPYKLQAQGPVHMIRIRVASVAIQWQNQKKH
jgi:hypothetical protein